jgi:LysR family transcriptional regulator, hydrogen peroxide-inducible genes activator
MTLTELKYIVAVAREKHFGRAADACFISQPTLSVSIKKLEEELDVKLFERSANEVTVTPLGEEIVRQAQSVLEQAANIREIAKRGKDPLAGALKLGVIYTIGPYLLPALVRQAIARTPQMPLMLQENFTVKLLEMLRTGEIDCAILAEPFPDTGLATAALYDEPFMVAVPSTHALAVRSSISAEELKTETMLLLGNGHCFRDHVLEVCPEFARFSSSAEGIRKSFEGSSLETIKHMVAAGMGVTVVPQLSVPRQALQQQAKMAEQAAAASKVVAKAASKASTKATTKAAAHATAKSKTAALQTDGDDETYVRYIPFHGDAPTRRVVLAWRRSFTRYEAIAALRNAVYACELAGVQRLSD